MGKGIKPQKCLVTVFFHDKKQHLMPDHNHFAFSLTLQRVKTEDIETVNYVRVMA